MHDVFSGNAAVISLLFLCLGLAVAWIAGRFIKPTEGSAIIALLILPFAAYMVFSGQLESFKGGGFEWKLQAAAARPAGTASLTDRLSTDDLARTAAQSHSLHNLAVFGIPQDVVLVKTTQWEALNHDQRLQAALKVGEVIYVSFLYGKFKALVVVDEVDRPVALFKKETFLDLLRIPFYLYMVSAPDTSHAATVSDVRAMIQQTELWTILRHPRQRAEASGAKAVFSELATRLDALRTMVANDWDAAAVVDIRGAYAGLLWRPALVETVLLAGLAEPQEK